MRLDPVQDDDPRKAAADAVELQLRQELGNMHIYCNSNNVCVFDWGTVSIGVTLDNIDYTKPDELLDRLRTAWVQHLITGERIEA